MVLGDVLVLAACVGCGRRVEAIVPATMALRRKDRRCMVDRELLALPGAVLSGSGFMGSRVRT